VGSFSLPTHFFNPKDFLKAYPEMDKPFFVRSSGVFCPPGARASEFPSK
jgi:hypothetical protein